MKNRFLIWVFSFFVVNCYSQNLVPDPCFDQYKKCPSSIIQNIKKFPMEYWNIPTLGTADYYNKCDSKTHRPSVGVPKNVQGYQYSKCGDGYGGILRTRFQSEYLQTPLLKKLKKGNRYCVRFYVSLANSSGYSASMIGAYFHDSIVKESTYKLLDYKPHIYTTLHVKDTTNWVKIEGEIEAKGTESYMVIGFFKGKKSYKRIKEYNYLHPRRKESYYYIDDVSVVLLNKNQNCSCLKDSLNLNSAEYPDKDQEVTDPFLKTKLTLPEISFKTNEANLSSAVFPFLDTLVLRLKASEDLNVVIEGHTDKTGDETANLKLSQKRADAVKDYLIMKGISKDRIKTEGKGSLVPVASNETEEGRRKNRRVEVLLIRK